MMQEDIIQGQQRHNYTITLEEFVSIVHHNGDHDDDGNDDMYDNDDEENDNVELHLQRQQEQEQQEQVIQGKNFVDKLLYSGIDNDREMILLPNGKIGTLRQRKYLVEDGTSIGRKRIHLIPPVFHDPQVHATSSSSSPSSSSITRVVILNITNAIAPPQIKFFGIFEPCYPAKDVIFTHKSKKGKGSGI